MPYKPLEGSNEKEAACKEEEAESRQNVNVSHIASYSIMMKPTSARGLFQEKIS